MKLYHFLPMEYPFQEKVIVLTETPGIFFKESLPM